MPDFLGLTMHVEYIKNIEKERKIMSSGLYHAENSASERAI
jgi:hypothetical protein